MDKNSGSDDIAARMFVHDFLIGLNAILAQDYVIGIYVLTSVESGVVLFEILSVTSAEKYPEKTKDFISWPLSRRSIYNHTKSFLYAWK